MSLGTLRAAGGDVLAAEVALEGQERHGSGKAGVVIAGIIGQLVVALPLVVRFPGGRLVGEVVLVGAPLLGVAVLP